MAFRASTSTTMAVFQLAKHFQSRIKPLGSLRRSLATRRAQTLNIELIPCLKDNYAYLLHDEDIVAVVDPSEAEPVIDVLERKNDMLLTHILNTHHHCDHTGGNYDLKKRYFSELVAPPYDRIYDIDVPLCGGDIWTLGTHKVHVIETPGHTRGHLCYYFPDSKAVFTGDTLFSLGCGRIFEGTSEEMWSSLSKLAALPDDTAIYCGHEYTLSNAKFAVSLEPNNPALKSKFQQVKELHDRGLATIPSTIGEEKQFNPFLRPFSAEIRSTLKLPSDAKDVEVFAAVRKAKDAAK